MYQVYKNGRSSDGIFWNRLGSHLIQMKYTEHSVRKHVDTDIRESKWPVRVFGERGCQTRVIVSTTRLYSFFRTRQGLLRPHMQAKSHGRYACSWGRLVVTACLLLLGRPSRSFMMSAATLKLALTVLPNSIKQAPARYGLQRSGA